MKILVIGNYYYPEHIGGVETVSFYLAKNYRELGQEVRWMAADVPPSFRKINEGDVPVRSWNITEEKFGFPSPIPFPQVFAKLYTNIKWCDVVHLQDCLYLTNILAFLISKLLRKPVLITQYAKIIPYAQFYKRALQVAAYFTIGRLMFVTAEELVFITSNVRDGMKHINPGSEYEVVPLGVDTDFYAPISEENRVRLRQRLGVDPSKPLILFVGRMVERKGVHLIHPLIEKHSEWHWVLVGRPDDYNPGDWQMDNLTYFRNVSETELRDLYASVDLLVHPSQGEGFTLTASECVACGTPILASEECLDEIPEQERSLFFSVFPGTDNIEEDLTRILADRQQLSKLRPKCREFAEKRLSWARVAQQYLDRLHRLQATR